MVEGLEIMQVIKKGAIFSSDRKYRYLLERELEKGNKNVCFIMLNPSIADENQDDPTIRRVISFAKKFDAKILWVVNLFGFITSNPDTLKTVANPIGKDNNRFIKKYTKLADMIILAWGSKGDLLKRDQDVLKMLYEFEDKVYALKLLKDKKPSHPLYLPKDIQLVKYFK